MIPTAVVSLATGVLCIAALTCHAAGAAGDIAAGTQPSKFRLLSEGMEVEEVLQEVITRFNLDLNISDPSRARAMSALE